MEVIQESKTYVIKDSSLQIRVIVYSDNRITLLTKNNIGSFTFTKSNPDIIKKIADMFLCAIELSVK